MDTEHARNYNNNNNDDDANYDGQRWIHINAWNINFLLIFFGSLALGEFMQWNVVYRWTGE